jgi:hypothetical protein
MNLNELKMKFLFIIVIGLSSCAPIKSPSGGNGIPVYSPCIDITAQCSHDGKYIFCTPVFNILSA